MPYIKDKARDSLADGRSPESPGELNYAITVLIRDYYHMMGEDYVSINDIMGALEGAKMEFYRRVVAPFEDQKIKSKGDVY